MALGADNGMEWYVSMIDMFLDAPYLAFWGWTIWWMLPLLGFWVLIDPNAKPTVDNINGKKEDWFFNWWTISITSTVQLFAPYMYMLEQLFTWGESDLESLQIFYMTTEELLWFYFIEWNFLPFAWVWATTMATLFLPVYCIIWFFDLWEWFIQATIVDAMYQIDM